MPTIENTFDELTKYYETLNTDKTTYTSTNDEPTPLECISEMIQSIPPDFWARD